jgi:hypothetical protein
MAMNRFPCEQYASLELNQVAFPKTGMVVSQTPLGPKFTADSSVTGAYGVCENGMWVVADKAAGVIDAPAAATDSPIGIVYTAEKEYDIFHYGLKTFGRKVAGDYPRVGIFGLGDTVTANCLQYDTTYFANDEALDTALKDIEANPLYVAIKAGSPIPQILKAANIPASGILAKVVKYYTVPNGEKGIKYQIVRL